MRCPEQNRLRQHYEAALRHWGHVILCSDANLVGALSRQAAEIKQKPFDEKNATFRCLVFCAALTLAANVVCASGLLDCSTRFKTSSCPLKRFQKLVAARI